MKPDAGEMRAAAASVGLAAAFALAVLASGRIPIGPFLGLLKVYAQSLGALALVVGAVALFVACGQRARAEGALPSPFGVIREFVGLRWRRDRFLSVIAPPVVCMLTLAAFNAFKQIILPDAAFDLDGLFAAMDKALFFGTDPWVVSHALFGSVAATNIIDAFYHGWFVPMTLGITVSAFVGSSVLRTQYMLTYTLSWLVIGSILAYLLPAAGPCYFGDFAGHSQTFDALMTRLRDIDATLVASGDGGLSALRNQAALLRHFDSGNLALGGGISAMPSMHNALAVLFALGGMRLNRTLGWLMWAYALLIWIGSVHLGWHYAIDGLVSGVLTIAIWIGCGRVADALLAARATRTRYAFAE